MQKPPDTIEAIQSDLSSTDQGARGRAMQALLKLVRNGPTQREKAWPLFWTALQTADDAWTATTAAQGIEAIAGPEGARDAWLSLLDRQDAVFVARVARAVTDSWYVPALIALLSRRNEAYVQKSIIRTLGRLQNPAIFSTLIEFLNTRALTADVIEALADLKDPRAIPYLYPFLQDKTEADVDERGHVTFMWELASSVLWRLGVRETLDTPERPTRTNGPPPLPSPTRAMQPASCKPAFRLRVLWPIAIAAMCVLWAIGCIFVVFVVFGSTHNTPAQTRAWDVIVLCPTLIGLGFSIILARTIKPTWIELLPIAIGCLICVGIVLLFGMEALN